MQSAWHGPEPPVVDRHAPEVPPLGLHTIAGHIRLSAELAAEIRERAIGPWHGPPTPRPLELRRRLAGHPTGPYRTRRARLVSQRFPDARWP